MRVLTTKAEGGTFQQRLGAELGRRRGELGLTMGQVAESAGIGRATYCDLENGKSNVTLGTLTKVLEVLDVTVTFTFRQKE